MHAAGAQNPKMKKNVLVAQPPPVSACYLASCSIGCEFAISCFIDSADQQNSEFSVTPSGLFRDHCLDHRDRRDRACVLDFAGYSAVPKHPPNQTRGLCPLFPATARSERTPSFIILNS